VADPHEYSDLIARAAAFHPWDAMAPTALSGIAERACRRPLLATAETGCGGSTIVLSHLSRRHTVFAIEGENHTISELSRHADLERSRVEFVNGLSKETLPAHRFEDALDLVLLDGPHAYPLPQIEYAYLFPHLRTGGWLILDDLQIRSVHELFRFLRQEPGLELEEVVARTAFFRKTGEGAAIEAGPDGWWLQGMNRRPVLRYSWRDLLRKAIRFRV
jgi:precorrin-6B methylase 2